MNELLGGPAKYWLDLRGYKPADEAKALSRPMLILQGERDYQVTMEDFASWKKALGSRKYVTFISYPKLNHLFVEGEGKSAPAEYSVPGNVAKAVVEDIAKWIGGLNPLTTGTKTSFKGWELYVWQKDGDTFFSLLPGTNRLKTDEEITKAAVKGFDAIKPKLGELKPGEEIFVVGKKLMEPPPKDQATPVVEYGRKIGLKVQ